MFRFVSTVMATQFHKSLKQTQPINTLGSIFAVSECSRSYLSKLWSDTISYIADVKGLFDFLPACIDFADV